MYYDSFLCENVHYFCCHPSILPCVKYCFLIGPVALVVPRYTFNLQPYNPLIYNDTTRYVKMNHLSSHTLCTHNLEELQYIKR